MKKSQEDLLVEQKCINKEITQILKLQTNSGKKGCIFLPRSSATYTLPRGPHLGMEEPLPPHMLNS